MSANDELIARIDNYLTLPELNIVNVGGLLLACRAALSIPAPQGAVEALRELVRLFNADIIRQSPHATNEQVVQIVDALWDADAALSAAPAEGQTEPEYLCKICDAPADKYGYCSNCREMK